MKLVWYHPCTAAGVGTAWKTAGPQLSRSCSGVPAKGWWALCSSGSCPAHARDTWWLLAMLSLALPCRIPLFFWGGCSASIQSRSPHRRTKGSILSTWHLLPTWWQEQNCIKPILHLPPHQGAANICIVSSHFSSKTDLDSLWEKERKNSSTLHWSLGHITACSSRNRAGVADGETPDWTVQVMVKFVFHRTKQTHPRSK